MTSIITGGVGMTTSPKSCNSTSSHHQQSIQNNSSRPSSIRQQTQNYADTMVRHGQPRNMNSSTNQPSRSRSPLSPPISPLTAEHKQHPHHHQNSNQHSNHHHDDRQPHKELHGNAELSTTTNTAEVSSNSTPIIASGGGTRPNSHSANAVAPTEPPPAYLTRHGIHVVVDRLVRDILKERPDEPNSWMQRWLLEEHRAQCARKIQNQNSSCISRHGDACVPAAASSSLVSQHSTEQAAVLQSHLATESLSSETIHERHNCSDDDAPISSSTP